MTVRLTSIGAAGALLILTATAANAEMLRAHAGLGGANEPRLDIGAARTLEGVANPGVEIRRVLPGRA